MWDNITVDNTVNTFQNVSVYIHSGDITWGKYKNGIILYLKIQIIFFKNCTCIYKICNDRI